MSNKSNNGMGLVSVLGVVFIVLKLCGVISWSWWWVLSPFWLPMGITAGIVGVTVLGISIAQRFLGVKK